MRSSAAAYVIALVSVALAQDQTITVGQRGQLLFSPQFVTATKGSVISFNFTGPYYSVAESSYDALCKPTPKGFNSGMVPILNGEPSIWKVTVADDTTPMWFYSPEQTKSIRRCTAGMVGAINGQVLGKGFDEFVLAAKAAAWTVVYSTTRAELVVLPTTPPPTTTSSTDYLHLCDITTQAVFARQRFTVGKLRKYQYRCDCRRRRWCIVGGARDCDHSPMEKAPLEVVYRRQPSPMSPMEQPTQQISPFVVGMNPAGAIARDAAGPSASSATTSSIIPSTSAPESHIPRYRHPGASSSSSYTRPTSPTMSDLPSYHSEYGSSLSRAPSVAPTVSEPPSYYSSTTSGVSDPNLPPSGRWRHLPPVPQMKGGSTSATLSSVPERHFPGSESDSPSASYTTSS
ncbi:hypothetical protein C8Q80DRAFT_425204 [Daedaleopsis nitida]|nr:hypothetical protein C8Q80DRAFT_425204 [Daedaleopsis nitida]